MKLVNYLASSLLVSTLANASVDLPQLQAKAQAGEVLAMRQLADALNADTTNPRHAEMALRWYEQAATQSDLPSILKAAELHLYGASVKPTRAAQLYLQAAQLGDASAQYQLAMLYRRGFGVQQDIDRAEHWFVHAHESEHADATYQLAIILDEGLNNAEDNQRAAELYAEASKLGHGQASYHLAVMHDDGESMPEDDREAMLLYTLAAERGVGAAAYNLGVMHSNGDAINAKPEQAYYWFSIAAALAAEDAAQRQKQAAKLLSPQQIQQMDHAAQGFVARTKPTSPTTVTR
jgi:uncharacterized protein